MGRADSGRPRLVVVGGAGAMGRIVVRDLVETGRDFDIVVADYDATAARAVARPYRLHAIGLDVTRARPSALAGAFGLINCCHHSLNLPVMELALAVGAHYVDLGGLFHMTRKQRRLDARFRRRGLLALLGMGAAPGIVNVMARAAADELDEVREIHIAVGGIDRVQRPPGTLSASYSLRTILDEASLPAAVFTDGKLRFVPAMSGAEPVEFPPPVGLRRPSRTLHSEVATLPETYRKKGIREVSFRIAFPDELESQLRLVHALGLTGTRPVKLGKTPVVPREVLFALLARLPPSPPAGPPDEHEVLRVTVRGERDRAKVETVLDCHAPGIPAWGVGVDADTGCPPSIAMQLLLRGDIVARGALPAEVAVPPAPFFAELEKRGMHIQRHTRRAA